jgi:hypothetical protein
VIGARGQRLTEARETSTAWVKWTVIAMLGAAALHLAVVLVLYPSEIYWLSYYVNNYEFGFVRRGLGGQLVRMVPEAHYFVAAYTLMWAPVVIWFLTLAVLLRQILAHGVRSNRRVMLALLFPVLPFAFSYAVYTPRPELLAMSALVAFGIVLRGIDSGRRLLRLSATYGAVIAVLAFAHEGIPLMLALGAVLAIIVLPKPVTPRIRRLALALAVGPGLVASLAIGLVARRDVAGRLCELIPRRQIDDPYAASSNLNDYWAYLTGKLESTTDFHDWSCQFGTALIDKSVTDGLRDVATFGFGPLFASTVVGIIYLAATIWAVQRFSGVSFRDFTAPLRGNLAYLGLAAALLVPVFMSGVDWTRWWVLITFDIALVYTLYTVQRPELDEQPPRGTLRVFLVVLAVLCVLPTGAALHVGGENFESTAESGQ